MITPPPREHEPDGAAEDTATLLLASRYPVTSAYLAIMVTLILLAVVFDWRI